MEPSTAKEPSELTTYPTNGPALDHQLRALQEAGLKPGHCWWMDPGAGKTFTAIAEAGHLFQQGLIDGVLIVAPLGPHIQWGEEQFPLWANYPWTWVHNKMTKKQQNTYFRVTNRPGLAVAAINYDTIWRKSGMDFVDRFMAINPRIYLVIDESHKVKDPKSRRSKYLRKLAERCAYRRALSGTPLLNGLEDLFNQYDTIEPGSTGYRTFTTFKHHYTIQRPIPGARSRFAQMIVGYQNEDELKERTAPIATRVKAEEFMKGEKPTFSKEWILMEKGEWASAYSQMKEEALIELERAEVEVENPLGILQKLQQIACGFVYDDERNPIWFDQSRIQRAQELVLGLDEPVILWTPFRAFLEPLRAALHEIDRPVFGKSNVDQWKDTPNGCLIGYQGSGLGVGMNLQHSAAAIYLGNTFSAEHRWQSIKRIDRIGQSRQVRIWDMVTPGTVDEKVLQALDAKENLAVNNVDALRSMIR